MKNIFKLGLSMCLASAFVIADETREVDTTRIKASRELPKVLYVVPWKDLEARKDTEEKLVLHDFFGDLYEPVLPAEFAGMDAKTN
ncbi:MAG: hypothetical protein EOO52_06250 [Gammaproteobacteria bacterium]|nr:MAG: hypothetical protein EOO52_06250 [Gammaproteobacteria bacterium]